MSDRPELPALILALKELSWSDVKQMAIHLDGCVDLTLLTNIEGGYPIEECLMYAMKAWLERDCEASWAKVVAALRAVSKNALAVRVETEYVTADNSILRPNHSELRSSPPGVSPQLSNEVHAALATPSLVHVEPQPTLELALLCHSQPENTATPGSMALSQVSTESLVPAVDCSATDSSAGGSESGGTRVQALTGEAAQLQEQFVTVLAHTKIYFMEKETESQKFLRKFQVTVTTLPLSKKYQHLHFLKQEKDAIMNAENVSEVFDILDPYWNYVDYDFLKYIIKEFGTRQLRKEMKMYIAELEKFEKKTSVQDYNLATLNQRNVPAYFKRVTVTQLKDPAKCSLFEVRQLKNEIVNQSTLNGYAVFLEGVSCSSVEINLAFPPEAYKELSVVFDVQFMTTHRIVSKVFSDRESSEDTTSATPMEERYKRLIQRKFESCTLQSFPSRSMSHSMEPHSLSALPHPQASKHLASISESAFTARKAVSEDAMLFRTMLKNAADQLTSEDIDALTYIHSMGKSGSERPTALEVFCLLEERGVFSADHLEPLEEILEGIKRYDVANMVVKAKRKGLRRSLSDQILSLRTHTTMLRAQSYTLLQTRKPRVSMSAFSSYSGFTSSSETLHETYVTSVLFRTMLKNAADQLRPEDVDALTYIHSVGKSGSKRPTALEVFRVLEERGIFSADRLEPLEEIFEGINRHDVAMVVKAKRKGVLGKHDIANLVNKDFRAGLRRSVSDQILSLRTHTTMDTILRAQSRMSILQTGQPRVSMMSAFSSYSGFTSSSETLPETYVTSVLFRTMLKNAADQLTSEDVDALTYIHSVGKSGSKRPTALEVFRVLEERGVFSADRLGPLEEILEGINRHDVANMVVKAKRKGVLGQHDIANVVIKDFRAGLRRSVSDQILSLRTHTTMDTILRAQSCMSILQTGQAHSLISSVTSQEKLIVGVPEPGVSEISSICGFVPSSETLPETHSTSVIFRTMLKNAADQLSRDDIDALTYILSMGKSGSERPTALEVFRLLEERGVFSADRLEPLKEILEHINRHDIAYTLKARMKGVPGQRKGLMGVPGSSRAAAEMSMLETSPGMHSQIGEATSSRFHPEEEGFVTKGFPSRQTAQGITRGSMGPHTLSFKKRMEWSINRLELSRRIVTHSNKPLMKGNFSLTAKGFRFRFRKPVSLLLKIYPFGLGKDENQSLTLEVVVKCRSDNLKSIGKLNLTITLSMGNHEQFLSETTWKKTLKTFQIHDFLPHEIITHKQSKSLDIVAEAYITFD